MKKIAVLIPCYNEELTIAKVIEDFRKEIPEAEVYVFDNSSTDRSASCAKNAGAIVKNVTPKGKGFVVGAMFREIEADYYLMVDGDDTYPAQDAKKLLEPVLNGECDMAVGNRCVEKGSPAFRAFHQFGNKLVTKIINYSFHSKIKDVFSGYRVFNQRIVNSLPLLSKGFEVEAEMTLQALDKWFVIKEIDVYYRARPEGSTSKLKTYSDGLLVIKTILSIIKDYKPLSFFSLISLAAFLIALGFGSFVISEYIETQKVYHPSTAVLAAALMIISILALVSGLILDSTRRQYSEQRVLILNQMSILRRKILQMDNPGYDQSDYQVSLKSK